MLTLLHPAALIGLTLLSIPILLHLFKPRKVRVVPFSSLRWMRSSQHRLSHRIRWHQVLLFLLRAAFVTLIVLALTRPTFWLGASGSAATGPVDRFIILDLSRSMNYRPTSRPAPVQTAVRLVRQLLEQSGPLTRTSVIVAGSPPRALGPLTADPTAYDKLLPGLHATAAAASLSDALPIAAAMIQGSDPDAKVQLVCVTDNLQDAWSQNRITSFLAGVGRPVSVQVMDVGAAEPQNAWVIGAQVLGERNQFVRVSLACRSAQPIQRTVRAFLDDDETPAAEEQVRIDPGRPAEVLLTLPARTEAPASILRVSLFPRDGLPDDDDYWLNLGEAGSAGVLVIRPDQRRPGGVESDVHLSTALAALRDAGAMIAVQRQTAGGVTVADVQRARAIYLVDAARLSAEIVTAIRSRVADGAGLAVFLGPTTDPAFVNEHFADLASVGELAQPAAQTGGLARLTGVNWDDPLFTDLGDPVFSDLRRVGVRLYRQVTAAEGTRTLAGIDNAAAGIVERDAGLGRVVLLNLSADDAWSDLARRASFIPLMDHLLARLSGQAHRGDFKAGGPVVLPLPDVEVPAGGEATATVTTPSGKSSRVALRASTPGKTESGDRAVLRLDSVSEPGVYRVSYRDRAGQRRTIRFVAQTDRRESALARADTDALRAWWSGADLEVTRIDDATAGAPLQAATGIDLTPWAVLVACLALLAEMYLVHRLCPTVNPTVVSSVVVARGRITQGVSS